jgi:hypothetical protein
MLKHPAFGVALVAGSLLLVGCESAKETAKKAGDRAKGAVAVVEKEAKKALAEAKDVKKDAEKALAHAKEAVVKPIAEMLPKIEEKIKALTGDKQKAASTKLEEFKKLLDEFKASGSEKMGELKEKLSKAYDELKQLVGL